MPSTVKKRGGDRQRTDAARAAHAEARSTDEQQQPPPDEDDDQPLFFYMPTEKYGEFCQWYKSTFTVPKARIAELVGSPSNHDETKSKGKEGDDAPAGAEEGDSIEFNCAEQFMMYCKAARFGDAERQARILATASPKEQKALGRATPNFDAASWEAVREAVVEEGNMAKFGQSRRLRARLLSTGRRTLCEAAGRDRVWGIGYTGKHAMQFRAHWGLNLLGLALMRVRARLRAEEAREEGYEWVEEMGEDGEGG